MNTRAPFVPVVLCLTLPVALLAEVRDQQKDLDQLQACVVQAFNPFNARLNNFSAALLQRFGRVRDIAQSENPDKGELAAALRELSEEYGRFVEDWGPELVKPVWEAQQQVSQTITENQRFLLSDPPENGTSAAAVALRKRVDERLAALARELAQEKNPARKRQLEITIKQLLGIRDLPESLRLAQTGQAWQAALARAIDQLSALELDLVSKAFALEGTQIVLEAQRDMFASYADVLSKLDDADKIAAMIGQIGDGAQLPEQLEQITKFANELPGIIGPAIGTAGDLPVLTGGMPGSGEAVLDEEDQKKLEEILRAFPEQNGK